MKSGPSPSLALTEAGKLSEAEGVLNAAVAQATARDDQAAQAHAEVVQLFARLQVDTEAGAGEIRRRFDPLLALFERDGDDLGLSRLWRLRALVHWIEARSTDAEPAWERAAEHARRAGDERGWAETLSWLASSTYLGPVPVEEVRRSRASRTRCEVKRRRAVPALSARPGALRSSLATADMVVLGTSLHPTSLADKS